MWCSVSVMLLDDVVAFSTAEAAGAASTVALFGGEACVMLSAAVLAFRSTMAADRSFSVSCSPAVVALVRLLVVTLADGIAGLVSFVRGAGFAASPVSEAFVAMAESFSDEVPFCDPFLLVTVALFLASTLS